MASGFFQARAPGEGDIFLFGPPLLRLAMARRFWTHNMQCDARGDEHLSYARASIRPSVW
jgi:hypothetical protein